MQSLLAFFIWPDSIPPGVEYLLLSLLPLGLLSLAAEPLLSLAQLPLIAGGVSIVMGSVARRLRRKGWWDALDTWILTGAAVATYLVVVTATNLLVIWLWP